MNDQPVIPNRLLIDCEKPKVYGTKNSDLADWIIRVDRSFDLCNLRLNSARTLNNNRKE